MGVVGRLDQYASMLAWEFDDYSMSENLVSYSTYTASNWINNFPAGASITTGITAPDGTNTAVRLTCTNTTNALLRVNIPSLTPNGTDTYTTSFYVRKISGTGGAFTDLGDGNPSADYSSQLVTNQWVRVTVSGVPTATAKTFLDLFSDNNTNYVLDFWGAQVERGSVATDYTPTIGATISRILPATTNTNITGLGTYYSSGFNENVGFTTFLSANILPPYDPVYDEFGGTLFGAGQGRYMRQNIDKSVIVYNEIDEISDFRDIVRTGLLLDLDAGMNSSYSGSGIIWKDLSGNGNNGTLINGPTYSSANGGSIVFDGSNDTVRIPISASLQSANFTFDIWVKSNVSVGDQMFFSSHYETYGTPSGIRSGITTDIGITGGARAYYYSTYLDGTIESTSGGIFNPSSYTNVWINVVGTWDGTDKKRYFNGAYVGAQNVPGQIHRQLNDFYLGNNADQIVNNNYTNSVLNGNIASFKFYNRALSATEISQNYNTLRGRYGV